MKARIQQLRRNQPSPFVRALLFLIVFCGVINILFWDQLQWPSIINASGGGMVGAPFQPTFTEKGELCPVPRYIDVMDPRLSNEFLRPALTSQTDQIGKDEVWRHISSNFFTLEGEFFPDCWEENQGVHCHCFRALKESGLRSLRSLPGLTTIDMDISTGHNLPYNALYAASQGHQVYVFVNSVPKVALIKQIALRYNLNIIVIPSSTIKPAIYDLDHHVPVDWVIQATISAAGNEEHVLQGMRDLLERRLVTMVQIRFSPSLIRSRGLRPPVVLEWFLRNSWHLWVLSSNQTVPGFSVNTMITEWNLPDFIKAIGNGFVYLFGSRGIDVASPSSTVYKTFSNLTELSSKFRSNSTEIYKTCATTTFDVKLTDDILTVTCADGSPPIQASFTIAGDGNVTSYSGPVKVNSEEICVKANCENRGWENSLEYSGEKCVVQFQPKLQLLEKSSQDPNLLVILVDAMGRRTRNEQLQKTMNFLRNFLPEEFVHVELKNQSVIGPNSGPNQAGLYAGLPAGQRVEAGPKGDEWLWVKMKNSGKIIMKAENMCWKHSGLLKALGMKEISDHHLLDLFCSPNYYTPNCIGGQYSHKYMLDYTSQFVNAYSNQSWAAFLNFGEAHEDSVSLGGVLDTDLTLFLENFILKNPAANRTAVILLSDHGLHFGPYYQSAIGFRDHKSPFFSFVLPKIQLEKFPMGMENLLKNQVEKTTSLDVYHTIRELMGFEPKTNNTAGQSLLSKLPMGRTCQQAHIPREYCLDDVNPVNFDRCVVSTAGSSPLSYYSDALEPYVPKDPMGTPCSQKNHMTLSQAFPKVPKKESQKPSVYYIGINGISREHAVRHLRQVKQFLKNSEEKTRGNFRAFPMELFNTLAYNAVPSMVALTSGCAVKDLTGLWRPHWPPISKTEGFTTVKTSQYQNICPRATSPFLWEEFGKSHVTLLQVETCSSSNFSTFFPERKFTADVVLNNYPCSGDCIGKRNSANVILGDLLEFSRNFNNVSRFSYTELVSQSDFAMEWESFKLNRAKMFDEPLVQFLQKIFQLEKNRETLIILGSHHGINFGWYPLELAGKVEHKSPLMWLIASSHLMKRFPKMAENFSQNRNRLTTMHDIHATIRDVMAGSIQPRSTSQDWGMSLLHQIPINRTCDDAKIPKSYCACNYAEEAWYCAHAFTDRVNCDDDPNKVASNERI